MRLVRIDVQPPLNRLVPTGEAVRRRAAVPLAHVEHDLRVGLLARACLPVLLREVGLDSGLTVDREDESGCGCEDLPHAAAIASTTRRGSPGNGHPTRST